MTADIQREVLATRIGLTGCLTPEGGAHVHGCFFMLVINKTRRDNDIIINRQVG
jgi:hypothetical protein